MFGKLKNEIENFSHWFKIAFWALFFVYLGSWVFSIYLSNIQTQANLKPVLPIMAKDSEEYQGLIESLINDHRFFLGGKINTVRAPGYHFFAAVFKTLGNSYFAWHASREYIYWRGSA